MEKLDCKLSNCYGINRLEHEFDFSESDVVAVYARNGLMKTSFSKVFKKIQENKSSEIRDEIFNKQGIADILIDGNEVNPESIFVIKSFESYYESDSIIDLLVNDDIKTQITKVLKLCNKFLKELEKKSGLKISKIQLGKKVYELEPVLIKDLNLPENSFLLNLSRIKELHVDYECSGIKYNSIFDSSVLKKIRNEKFQNRIGEFCEASEEIYKSYNFFDKGKFTLPKLKNVAKSLNNDKFFVKGNSLYLGNEIEIKNSEAFDEQIKEIETQIKEVPAFREIERLLSDSKGIVLRDVIENNSEIIPYFKLDKLNTLKKQLWISYIKDLSQEFEELCNEYSILEHKINNVDFEDTQWNAALKIFEERFTVPYKMNIANIKSAIIGESIPRVEFSFEKEGKTVALKRDELEKKDVLSQGEKRALYLLNIIFDIEKLKSAERDILFIVDDIADSFDYKNKYAIIEYLYEMSKVTNFKLLILSHNFDFYRTVSSRLSLKRNSRLCVERKDGEIEIKQEKYQKQPFNHWKTKLNYTNTLALIPFVRNIIEYRCENPETNPDYITLTSLLHQKDDSKDITFSAIHDIYKRYFDSITFNEEVNMEVCVLDQMEKEAEAISLHHSELEHKVILAMAIRHKAEQYMISLICQYTGTLRWENKNQELSSSEFIEKLKDRGNQTRVLYGGVKQFADKEIIRLLDEVNIMTPENIHLNSFMYEPLLDMDISELYVLYYKIKQI